jgi:hypothetical protein
MVLQIRDPTRPVGGQIKRTFKGTMVYCDGEKVEKQARKQGRERIPE